ncbi:hypothetical protein WT21_23520 [Burkholderia territorii]|nr:hypothetical protein WT21_23520 [Burkholderia territorii]
MKRRPRVPCGASTSRRKSCRRARCAFADAGAEIVADGAMSGSCSRVVFGARHACVAHRA